MSFTDFWFYPTAVLLLGIVVLAQAVLRKKEIFSNAVSKTFLLVFSYIAMGMYDWRFCLCMTGVILFTYAAGIGIEKTGEGKARHTLTALAVVTLVLVLGIFKYLNFFMSTAFGIVGKSWSALSIILPLGISFYIFSAIGYVLDVSWGKIKAERNLFDMALFLAFFPKQVCGPIVNARDFLPQLKENRRVTLRSLEAGAQIFIFGFFKKLVLADHLAVFVDDVYHAPAAYGTATIWLAVFSYFLQLYFDFSGYSDMAIGTAKMFGYDIRRNFNLPFTARNISDFWDRWHISLSSWLNEYVFNPVALKFKRIVAGWSKEKRRRYKNLPTYSAVLITFFVSGLWHGAGFTFIVWGLLQGVISVLHGIYAGWMHKHHRDFARNKPKWVILADVLANYFVLNLIQIFFRAESLGKAFYIFKRMFTINVGIEQPYIWAFLGAVLLLIATAAACVRSHKQGLHEVEGYYVINDLNTVRGLTVFFTVCGLAVCLMYIGETYFIYGNF